MGNYFMYRIKYIETGHIKTLTLGQNFSSCGQNTRRIFK